ncbi:PAS domain S-box [uncultured Desulfobacterium sp.]|uniref:histidine kinase n=1 Tax=uncultured Desulfobacterium sp. TaxID=201089 RepID=A0A445MQX7_9BACT|nr:PAS domain S-box [uncultured Desulfobacterium sp.]
MTAIKGNKTVTKIPDQHRVNEPFAFYKLIVESVPSAVITVDKNLKITGFNPWAERVTGYRAEEANGRYCREILQGGICDSQCPLRTALGGHEPISLVESTVKTKSGETISVRMNVAALFDEKGDLIGGIESFEDISALKALERERNNLITTLAHDMKSSLSIIGGFVLRLLNKSNKFDPEKEKRYLEIIRDESAKLDMLISDFLDFVRLQTGRLKLNFNAASLDKELMEICELYQSKLAEIGLKLELENEHSLPPIMCDTRQLRRVFTNLFDNAIKFSKYGGKIIVTAVDTGDDVIVKVTDEGTGISNDDLPYIFDAFHRGNIRTKAEGFGLGLAAVKTIIEAHGGRVIVESKVNRGSTFTVVLPKGIDRAQKYL